MGGPVFLCVVIALRLKRHTKIKRMQGGMRVKSIRRNAALVLIVCAAAALTGAASVAAQRTVVSERSENRVMVIAHRGGAAHAPENTLAALEYAVAAGADMAEFDLRMTKDSVPVVLHDELLTRTTGYEQQVSQTDSRTLSRLDAGKWFSEQFQGERVPTLSQLLDAAQGRIRLMLELKSVVSDELLLEYTVEQIRARSMEAECVLAFTDPEVLRRGKELAPELENVYIGPQMKEELLGLPYLDGCSIALDGLTAQDVKRAHEGGRKVYVWTVNEREDVLKVLGMEVDGVVTDDPGVAIELLGQQ